MQQVLVILLHLLGSLLLLCFFTSLAFLADVEPALTPAPGRLPPRPLGVGGNIAAGDGEDLLAIGGIEGSGDRPRSRLVLATQDQDQESPL